MSKAFVLYVDHQGHPAPLAECYHATASRRLSSSVHRHPPSTTTEIDSAFCPQCLSFHDAGTASSLGYCPKPSCRRCPLCLSVASIVVDEEKSDECLYKCGFCTWTSRSCNLTASITKKDDGTVDQDELNRAVEALGDALNRRKRDENEPTEALFSSILNAWETEFKAGENRLLTRAGLSSVLSTKKDSQAWSIDALEESIRSKREQSKADASAVLGGLQLEKIALSNPLTVDPSLNGVSTQAILLQPMVASKKTESLEDLLPLPMPLRSRKSRRCRAEIAEGRPGILLKTKLNPLEGDSSLRTGHGKWFKKDSSAFHVVPIVRVMSRISNDNQHSFLLRVKNPTLGIVRFRLGCSTYLGEPSWDGTEPSNFLEDVLLDSISRKRANVAVQSKWTESLQVTDLIELDCLEDTSLEMAKVSPDEPAAVLEWNGSVVQGKNQAASLRLVAQQSDTAWIELLVTGEFAQVDNATAAISLALQIEVGNGSWEYSLIKPNTADGDNEKDFVTLDLLVAWDIQ